MDSGFGSSHSRVASSSCVPIRRKRRSAGFSKMASPPEPGCSWSNYAVTELRKTPRDYKHCVGTAAKPKAPIEGSHTFRRRCLFMEAFRMLNSVHNQGYFAKHSPIARRSGAPPAPPDICPIKSGRARPSGRRLMPSPGLQEPESLRNLFAGHSQTTLRNMSGKAPGPIRQRKDWESTLSIVEILDQYICSRLAR